MYAVYAFFNQAIRSNASTHGASRRSIGVLIRSFWQTPDSRLRTRT